MTQKELLARFFDSATIELSVADEHGIDLTNGHGDLLTITARDGQLVYEVMLEEPQETDEEEQNKTAVSPQFPWPGNGRLSKG